MKGKSGKKFVDKHIGLKLRLLRMGKKVSQYNLGKSLRVSIEQVQIYENGQERIGAEMLWSICQIFNVWPEYFFDGLDEKLRSPLVANDNASIRLV